MVQQNNENPVFTYVNKGIITGIISSEPEFKYVGNRQVPILKIRISVPKSTYNKTHEKEYYSVTVLHGLAEKYKHDFNIGDVVIIDYQLQQRKIPISVSNVVDTNDVPSVEMRVIYELRATNIRNVTNPHVVSNKE